MRFKRETAGAQTDYKTRQALNQRLDEVLADLCIPGATWKLSSSQPPVPIQLRRTKLQPLARGWQEFIIHSLVPTGNKSEIITSRAILIHTLMQGEDVRVEEIIADDAEPTLYVSSPTYNVGNLAFNVRFQQRLHVISGSYTYNVEAFLSFFIFFNSNSNPRSFGHQFHPLIKGIIGRVKRRLIED
ncbi:hypothetical protein PIB30_098748 [Stylosanthes scabra]|uniref:Putative plant transposon protein domain-containing protein n=1 Tax=Stylosanthes scabra TaxID=79078 RepID=A0ABU6TWB9_9FABA|nr:hypothetical protein [Stylosanthes scabra]